MATRCGFKSHALSNYRGTPDVVTENCSYKPVAIELSEPRRLTYVESDTPTVASEISEGGTFQLLRDFDGNLVGVEIYTDGKVQ